MPKGGAADLAGGEWWRLLKPAFIISSSRRRPGSHRLGLTHRRDPGLRRDDDSIRTADLARPAARQRAEQRDLAARDLPVLRREHRFGLGEGALGVEPFERIRRALLPLRAHDPRRAFGLIARR